MDRQLRQQQANHERFGAHMEQAPTADIPAAVGEVRAHLIAEELEEYRAAFAAGDLIEIADALTDLLYLVLGTYHSHGLQDIAAETGAVIYGPAGVSGVTNTLFGGDSFVFAGRRVEVLATPGHTLDMLNYHLVMLPDHKSLIHFA